MLSKISPKMFIIGIVLFMALGFVSIYINTSQIQQNSELIRAGNEETNARFDANREEGLVVIEDIFNRLDRVDGHTNDTYDTVIEIKELISGYLINQSAK